MIENKRRQSLPDIDKVRDSSLANGSEFNLTQFVDSGVESRPAFSTFDPSPTKVYFATTDEDTIAAQNAVLGNGSAKRTNENETDLNSSFIIKEEIDRFSILDDQRKELERIIKKKKRKMQNQQIQ